MDIGAKRSNKTLYNKMDNSVYLCQLKVKDYKSFLSDNEFNFAIQDKKGRFRLPQCTVFLGDNGTGKTNLLKVIANLLPERVKVEDVKNDAPIADMHVSLDINDNSGKPEKEKGSGDGSGIMVHDSGFMIHGPHWVHGS